MIENHFVCDRCHKKLETLAYRTPFGIVQTVLGTGRTEVIDTSCVFQHLCKECALLIDNNLLKFKNELLDRKSQSKSEKSYSRYRVTKARK